MHTFRHLLGPWNMYPRDKGGLEYLEFSGDFCGLQYAKTCPWRDDVGVLLECF